MMRRRKSQRHCDGCQRDVGASYRSLPDLFLCDPCYADWRLTGEVPGAEVDDPKTEGRW